MGPVGYRDRGMVYLEVKVGVRPTSFCRVGVRIQGVGSVLLVFLLEIVCEGMHARDDLIYRRLALL